MKENNHKIIKAFKAEDLEEVKKFLKEFPEETYKKNPYLRHLEVLIDYGKPPGQYHTILLKRDGQNYLIGTIVFSQGEKIIFFPGIQNLFVPSPITKKSYNIHHITCEKSLKEVKEITIDEPVINRDDYKQHVSTETAQYGNWVYDFARLEGVETLFPREIYDGYEPKDDLFEIWKLVKESDQNNRFSQLFYEVRHKEYDKTSNDYYKNFERDIGEQVFSTLVASGVSMAIMAASLGTATLLAHAAYIVIYATISKFQMDMKAREAEAMARSSSFLPEGIDRNEPTSLNQKITKDEFWGDSMPAALSGHPGAYYTTVMGGEVGAQYTAQAIVSPPNDARFWNKEDGMIGYLENNLFTLGHGDPDLFTELDFDNHNLDYLLVSSELYAYNDEEHILYMEDSDLVEVLLNPELVQEQFGTMITAENYVLSVISTRDSYAFRQNTLGYITKEVR